MPGQRDRGYTLFARHETLCAPTGVHRLEGQWILSHALLPGLEQKCSLTSALLSLCEPLVHGVHQLLGRTVVRTQHVVPPFGGASGAQIAVYVRAPEPVDRLLGITDQQQGTVGIIVCGSIDTVEEAVLQGRRVLEFVNQCYGVLRQNPRAQHSAVLACQSTVQALQHIREAKRPGLALEKLHALLNLGGGVQAYSNMEAGQLRKG